MCLVAGVQLGNRPDLMQIGGWGRLGRVALGGGGWAEMPYGWFGAGKGNFPTKATRLQAVSKRIGLGAVIG